MMYFFIVIYREARYKIAIMIESLRHHKLTINLLIALAVFLNAIAPLSVVAKEFSATDSVSSESLFGDKILICTPTGFKYISIEELHERQNNGQDDSQTHCVLCQINAPVNILVAIDLANVYEFEFRNSASRFYGTNQLQKPNSIYSDAKPRAPPLFL